MKLRLKIVNASVVLSLLGFKLSDSLMPFFVLVLLRYHTLVMHMHTKISDIAMIFKNLLDRKCLAQNVDMSDKSDMFTVVDCK